MEADAVSQATQIAWEMAQNGKPDAWNYICRDDYAYRPATDAFRQALAKDPASGADGRAMNAAFDGWYKCPPVRSYEMQWANRTVQLIDARHKTSADPTVAAMQMAQKHATPENRDEFHKDLVENFGLHALNRRDLRIGGQDLVGVGQRTDEDNALVNRFGDPAKLLEHPLVTAGPQVRQIRELMPTIEQYDAAYRELLKGTQVALGLVPPTRDRDQPNVTREEAASSVIQLAAGGGR